MGGGFSGLPSVSLLRCFFGRLEPGDGRGGIAGPVEAGRIWIDAALPKAVKFDLASCSRWAITWLPGLLIRA